jgi:hypothetical protein
MWLPREARVGVAPEISKQSTRKTKIPGAPPLLCRNEKKKMQEKRREQQENAKNGRRRGGGGRLRAK